MPNDIKKLRRLMFAANHLRKENPVILKGSPINPSQALKYAWWFEDFRAKLQTGVFRFSYFKKDGSIREARGTLDMSLIPEKDRPKSGLDPGASPRRNGESGLRQEGLTFSYYDLLAAGWRSFRIDNFIGFVEQIS